MLPQNKPDRIRILFDDHRLVANAGLILPATLALRLAISLGEHEVASLQGCSYHDPSPAYPDDPAIPALPMGEGRLGGVPWPSWAA